MSRFVSSSKIVYPSPAERMSTKRCGFKRWENHSRPEALRRRSPSETSWSRSGAYFSSGKDRLIQAQGDLGAGADEMLGDDHRIVRIDHRALESPAEKILRVVHEILVQGILLGDQGHQGFPVGPAHPSSPLPGGRHRPRVADQEANIQPADIDPQLQGAGGDHPQELARDQLGLDLPPLFREEPGPVRADPSSQVRPVLQNPGVQQLGDLPRLGERQGAKAGVEALQEEFGGERVGAGVRVQEKEMPPRAGRAALLHRFKRKAGQLLGKRLRGWRWWPNRR